jgi:Fe-Mn family superoxide dismutase
VGGIPLSMHNSPVSHPTRRDVCKTLGAGLLLAGAGARLRAAEPSSPPVAATPQPFVLPKLPYAYDALEPHFDARTMEIHHGKHHQAYITNANRALESHPELSALSGEALLAGLEQAPEPLRTTLRNNVGGHLNHAFFWESLTPRAGGVPEGALAAALTGAFGSFVQFQTVFADAAAKRFGSGWAWLVVAEGKLAVTSTPNQDSPLMAGQLPLLGLDVWEHAHYLAYQNRRADYVKAFWNVVDWSVVTRRFGAAA